MSHSRTHVAAAALGIASASVAGKNQGTSDELMWNRNENILVPASPLRINNSLEVENRIHHHLFRPRQALYTTGRTGMSNLRSSHQKRAPSAASNESGLLVVVKRVDLVFVAIVGDFAGDDGVFDVAAVVQW